MMNEPLSITVTVNDQQHTFTIYPPHFFGEGRSSQYYHTYHYSPRVADEHLGGTNSVQDAINDVARAITRLTN